MGYLSYDEPRGEQICRDISAVLLARQELKQAILEVLAEGDQGIPWYRAFGHPFGAVRDEAKERFADAVIQRVGKQ